MRYIKLFTIAAMCSTILTSCEKVIDLKLQNSEPTVVIEGKVTNDPAVGSVLILTESKNVKTDNSSKFLSGALVTIQQNNGTIYTLSETQPGEYVNRTLVGKIDSLYKLRIVYRGNIYSAESKMPKQIPFDSLKVEEFPNFGEVVNVVTPFYNDPIGLGNNYQFYLYRNSELVRQTFVNEDLFIDGRKVSFPLIYQRKEDKLKIGDRVDVEMLCIDRPNYNFWFSLTLASTGNSQSTPTNPITNIKGNAIGVFSAHTLQKRSVVVQ
jgi:hypothetical protein